MRSPERPNRAVRPSPNLNRYLPSEARRRARKLRRTFITTLAVVGAGLVTISSAGWLAAGGGHALRALSSLAGLG